MLADTSGKKKLAQILPAPAIGGGAGPSSGSSGPSHLTRTELPPKRQRRAGTGRFACDGCRIRKSACNGARPCGACVKRKVECVYPVSPERSMPSEDQAEIAQLRQENDDLKRQLAEETNVDIVDSLRRLPESDALRLLYRLRSNAGETESNIITSTDIPALALQTGLELKLITHYPIMYHTVSKDKPLALSSGSLPVTTQHQDLNIITELGSTPTKPDVGPADPSSPLLFERSPGRVCDPRLNQFEVNHWLVTKVPTEFAAAAISHYLETDHPVIALFDADLFLDDLVSYKTEFCCPMLLSAVLSVACQALSHTDSRAAEAAEVFFSEAQRLYKEEKAIDPQFESAIMTVAAAQLLSVAASRQGLEEVSQQYLVTGIQLAHQNGFLAVKKRNSARNWLDGDISNVRAASFAAWGTFCRATLVGMNFHTSYINVAPWLPIPGTTIGRREGETVQFPLSAYMGGTFTELCQLALIVNEILGHYYDSGDKVPPISRASFDQAETIYRRLLHWADSLPLSFARGPAMPYHVAVLHIQFHAIVLDLFRPFLYSAPRRPFIVERLTSEHPNPEQIYLVSTNQLKHLLLLVRSRYSAAKTSMMWHNAILYLANACLPFPAAKAMMHHPPGPPLTLLTEDGPDNDAGEMTDTDHRSLKAPQQDNSPRSWFLVCIDTYRAFTPQFPIVGGIIQGLLSMAILRGVITATEGRQILNECIVDVKQRYSAFGKAQTEEERLWSVSGLAQQTGVDGSDPTILTDTGTNAIPTLENFVMDLNMAAMNPSAASGQVLARTFEELAMVDDFRGDGEDDADIE